MKRLSQRTDYHRMPVYNSDAIWRRRGYITGRLFQLAVAFGLGVLAHAFFS
jgi:hypothetical protein